MYFVYFKWLSMQNQAMKKARTLRDATNLRWHFLYTFDVRRLLFDVDSTTWRWAAIAYEMTQHNCSMLLIESEINFTKLKNPHPTEMCVYILAAFVRFAYEFV